MKNPIPAGAAVDQLCPSCGLCCNGVIFKDARLQERDDAARLESLGLVLQRRRGGPAFRQPCSCFDGKLCRIYPERPERCRTFVCGVLKRAEAGALSGRAALRLIRRAQRQAGVVRELLRACGETDESVALSRRYERVMSAPMDLAAGREVLAARDQLMPAMEKLMQALQREFLAMG